MFRTSRWSSAFVPTQRRRTSFRTRRSVVALGSRVASDSRVGWLTSGDIPAHSGKGAVLLLGAAEGHLDPAGRQPSQQPLHPRSLRQARLITPWPANTKPLSRHCAGTRLIVQAHAVSWQQALPNWAGSTRRRRGRTVPRRQPAFHNPPLGHDGAIPRRCDA